MRSKPMASSSLEPTRRAALHALAASALGAWAGTPTWANTDPASSPNATNSASAQVWSQNFAPWNAPAFGGELHSGTLPVIGRPPAALNGRFYRNGPARFGRGSTRLSHWFDGDGMVQRFDIHGAHASHVGRLLDTPKSREETTQGRFLYNGFGSQVPEAQPLLRPDLANPANINLLAMRGGQDLYALWEAGSALQIDPDSLHTRGLKNWSADTAGAPFSAHPRVAADGTVWNFGYLSGSGRLLIYHLSAQGQLLRQQVLELPQTDMVHDFAITQHHLVFLLQPLLADLQNSTAHNLLDTLRWDTQAPLLACIVSQADFSVRRIELPNSGLFHIGNAWEEGNTLRLAYVHHNNLLDALRNFDILPHPRPRPQMRTQWREIVIDLPNRRAEVFDSGIEMVEFPRHDPRRTGKNSHLTVLLQRGSSLEHNGPMGFNQVLLLNGERLQRFDYGPGWLAEEHVLVPRPDRTEEASAWVLGTAYHWPSQRTTLSVFAAPAVADGPLAQWHLPYGLPLGLHGQFVAHSG
jgi:all-trans-8'-apo-beta-carotenal 15,15'-oxygenase